MLRVCVLKLRSYYPTQTLAQALLIVLPRSMLASTDFAFTGEQRPSNLATFLLLQGPLIPWTKGTFTCSICAHYTVSVPVTSIILRSCLLAETCLLLPGPDRIDRFAFTSEPRPSHRATSYCSATINAGIDRLRVYWRTKTLEPSDFSSSSRTTDTMDKRPLYLFYMCSLYSQRPRDQRHLM